MSIKFDTEKMKAMAKDFAGKDKVLTVRQAAKILDVSESSVRHYYLKGRMDFIKIGPPGTRRRVYLPLEWFLEFIDDYVDLEPVIDEIGQTPLFRQRQNGGK